MTFQCWIVGCKIFKKAQQELKIENSIGMSTISVKIFESWYFYIVVKFERYNSVSQAILLTKKHL